MALFSCNKSPKIISTLTLEQSKAITIPINSKSGDFSLLNQYYNSGTGIEYLIHINPFPSNPNYLFLDNISSPNSPIRLEFPVEGPNGIGSMTDFYFHNFDSIFVVDRYAYSLSLVDSSANLLRKYRLNHSQSNYPGDESVLPYFTSNSQAIKRGEILYLPGIPDKESFESGYSKHNLLMVLNLDTGELTYMLGYPSKYKSGFWGGYDHIIPSISETDDLNKLLISYPIDDSVYIFDLSKQELSPAFYAKSNLLDDINPAPRFAMDRESVISYQYGTDRYFSLFFDSYRKEYYRFVYKAYPEEALQNMLNRTAQTRIVNDKSLMRFDENFNLIKELKLPSTVTGVDDFISIKSGVYLRLYENNENSKKFIPIVFD